MDTKKKLNTTQHEQEEKITQHAHNAPGLANQEIEESSAVSNIKKAIEPNLQELKGQDPEVVYQTLKSAIQEEIPPEKLKDIAENSAIIKVVLPEENEAEPWNKKDGGVIRENFDDALRVAAKKISQGEKEQTGENSKKLKFTVPFGPGEIESLRNQGESAKNYIREKIKTAVAAANIDLNELNRGQKGVNFKNFGSRSVSIKTTGHTLIEALTEIIYVSVAQEMNPDQVKGTCEQNMGTASNTGMQAGNMIDDMINGTGDEVERTQEGFTFSAG